MAEHPCVHSRHTPLPARRVGTPMTCASRNPAAGQKVLRCQANAATPLFDGAGPAVAGHPRALHAGLARMRNRRVDRGPGGDRRLVHRRQPGGFDRLPASQRPARPLLLSAHHRLRRRPARLQQRWTPRQRGTPGPFPHDQRRSRCGLVQRSLRAAVGWHVRGCGAASGAPAGRLFPGDRRGRCQPRRLDRPLPRRTERDIGLHQPRGPFRATAGRTWSDQPELGHRRGLRRT